MVHPAFPPPHIPPSAPPSFYPLTLHLQKKVALPAVVIPTVALHYGGGGGHQIQGGGGGAGHDHLGELVWNVLILIYIDKHI